MGEKSSISSSYITAYALASKRLQRLPEEREHRKKLTPAKQLDNLDKFEGQLSALLEAMYKVGDHQSHTQSFKRVVKRAAKPLNCSVQDIELAYGILLETKIPRSLYRVFGQTAYDKQMAVLVDLKNEIAETRRLLTGGDRVFRTILADYIDYSTAEDCPPHPRPSKPRSLEA